jgi:type IV secretory pathway TrbF-like protein
MTSPVALPSEPTPPPAWRDDALTAEEKRSRNWRLACLIMAALAALPWVKIFRDDARSLIETHLIVANPDGQVVAYGPPGAFTVDETMLVGWLSEWLEWTITRPDDPVVLERSWEKAASMVLEGAAQQFDAYVTAETAKRAKEAGNPPRVTVRPKSYRKEGSTRFRVIYEVTTSPTFGYHVESREWRALFEVKFLSQLEANRRWSLTQGQLQHNPRVVYIVWYDLAPSMELAREPEPSR